MALSSTTNSYLRSVNPLKILVVSDYSDYHSVRPEAEIFLSLAALGHHIRVVTKAGSKYAKIFEAAGIQVIDQHPRSKYDKASIRAIRHIVEEWQPDVLHLYNNKALSNGLVAARGAAVAVIGYRGSTLNFSAVNPFNYAKHLSHRLDYVICNSAGVADKYYNHPFFDSKKVVTINKGHDLSWYESTVSRQLRQEYQLGDSTTIFILVATDRTMKGVKYLCKAVNQLPKDSDFALFMIGGGMDSANYGDLLAMGPHQDKVFRIGHTESALSYVAAADVFVLPSIKGESITKAVLEAMSLGVCPLITDIPGNQELVDDRKSGMVVRSADSTALATAMTALIADGESVANYGTAAKRRIATNLSHEKTVQGYLRLYDSIVTSSV